MDGNHDHQQHFLMDSSQHGGGGPPLLYNHPSIHQQDDDDDEDGFGNNIRERDARRSGQHVHGIHPNRGGAPLVLLLVVLPLVVGAFTASSFY